MCINGMNPVEVEINLIEMNEMCPYINIAAKTDHS